MRCAVYSRISTTGKGQDVENQAFQLRQFAASQGWLIVAEFQDEVSGSKGERNRPGFKTLMDSASRREFDVVLFWSLDRLSREGVLPTLSYLRRLTDYGVKWRSYTEQYIDSCGIFADCVVSIMATLAQQERLRLSERTRAGLARARREGKTLGRPRVAVDAEQIRALRSSGLSWSAIARTAGVTRATCQRLAGGLNA